MLKEEAIQEFLKLREEVGISRDRAIEVYNFFKLNPNAYEYTYCVGVDQVTIPRTELWSVINTTTIRELCKKNQTLEQCGDLSYLKLDFDNGEDNNDIFTSSECTKLRKDALAYKTKLDFERKAFNKQLKDISTLEELNRELIDKLKELKPTSYINSKKDLSYENTNVLLVQLSDLHINEITEEFMEVGYDIDIANKRLYKFAQEIKKQIKSQDIKKVVIAMTGDMCNSDTILSKQLNNATDKATSIIIATKLLEHFILDIKKECYNISVLSVAGNEGRFTKDFFTDENIITNSPDFLIFNMLEIILEDIDGISFIRGRNNEKVVNINGSNILFTHGNCYGKGDVGKAVAQTIARYSDKGVNIRFVVFGHIHSSKLSSYFMRSGSLVGNNSYATNTLNLNSRASQNIAIIGTYGDINPINIDLQNTSELKYDIEQYLSKFDIKQNKSKYTFHEIPII